MDLPGMVATPCKEHRIRIYQQITSYIQNGFMVRIRGTGGIFGGTNTVENLVSQSL
jgi:hypothetical protein